jgi:hypothetical protein
MNSNIQLGPGRLFIEGHDGPEYLGSVYELDTLDCTFEEEPWPKENPVIQRVLSEVLTFSIKMVGQAAQRALDALLGITEAVLELCPDKRVVHLAKHARKERTRKKNRRRAYRLMMKEAKR